MSNTDSPQTKESHDLENNTQPTEEKQGSSAFKALGWLDCLLAVWILLAMIIGILLGNFVPSTGAALEKGKFVGVSVPIGEKNTINSESTNIDDSVAVGLLVMMYPILCKVRYESLHEIFSQRDVWKQILFSIFINWIIAPFLMVSNDSPGLETLLTYTARPGMGLSSRQARTARRSYPRWSRTMHRHGADMERSCRRR